MAVMRAYVGSMICHSSSSPTAKTHRELQKRMGKAGTSRPMDEKRAKKKKKDKKRKRPPPLITATWLHGSVTV